MEPCVSGCSLRGHACSATNCGYKFMIQNSIFKISRGIKPRSLPAAERTGLRRGGAALRQGAAAGCCAHSGANSAFKIQHSKLPVGQQPAECALEAGLQDASSGPPPPPGCGPLRPFGRNSSFKIGCGANACGIESDDKAIRQKTAASPPLAAPAPLSGYSAAGPFGSSVPSGSVVTSSGSGAIRPRASSIARLSGSLPRKAR